MTNREAFNRFIREKVESQLAYIENMSNKELVDYTVQYPGFHIEVTIGNALSLFKCNSAGTPVGGPSKVIDWLDSERTEHEEKRWQESVEWNKQRNKRA